MGSLPSQISASRGAAICGASKYKTPFVAWLEIMEERQPGFCFKNGYEAPIRIDPWELPLNPKHAAMRWGLAFEDAICDIVGEVTDREKFCVHPEHDFITCHLDGIKTGINQENKTAFIMAYEKGWGEPGSNMVPKDYLIQSQTQMMCNGGEMTDFNALVFPKAPAEWEKMGYRVKQDSEFLRLPDKKGVFLTNFAKNLKQLGYFHQYHVEANKELQDEILKIYTTFWNENVLKEVPPPINGYDDIKWLIASPEGEIEATPAMKSLWSEKCDIENEVKSLLDRKDEIKDNFAKLIQIEIESKNVKPGHEDKKLNIFAGALRLGSITRGVTKVSVNKKMVTKIKDDSPALYEEMKKITFLDLMGEELDLTVKQKEKMDYIDSRVSGIECAVLNGEVVDDFKGLIEDLGKEQSKILKSFKLTKILSKDSIIKNLQKVKPEIYNVLYENSIIEETTPKSVLRLTGNKED